MGGIIDAVAVTRVRRALTLATLAVLALGAALLCQRLVIFPTWAAPEDPGFSPPGVARILIPTEDGETLLAYWRRPLPGRPTLVSFHGARGDAFGAAARFSRPPWSDDGWGFLAVSSRGYPGSSGVPSEAGYGRDAEAALAYLRRRLGPDRAIVAHGYGLGASTALALCARHRLDGLYLEAAAPTLAVALAARFPWFPAPLLLDRLDAAALAPGIAAPAFVVHGAADADVPPVQGRRLADLIPGATFVEVPGADHVDVRGADDARVAPALARILRGGPATRRLEAEARDAPAVAAAQ